MSRTVNYSRDLNRERVIDFEKEMTTKLESLADLERDMKDVSEKRRSWLQNISKADDTGMDVFLAKLNVLRLQAHLSSLHMALDVARLEGHYEAQALNYLVAATKPMEEGEDLETRKQSLLRLSRQDNDRMMNFLENSLQQRINLGNANYDLNSQLKIIVQEIGLVQQQEEEEFREKLNYYMTKMRSSMETSRKHYKRITEEYLVLRHNARVAKEVLVRSQNEASQARMKLQGVLDEIIAEATVQREKMEKIANSELKYLTEDLRSEVIRKEREVEHLTIHVKTLKSKQQKEVSALKKELEIYTKKYKKFQQTRKKEIQSIQDELKHLREMIAVLESKLSSVGIDPETAEGREGRASAPVMNLPVAGAGSSNIGTASSSTTDVNHNQLLVRLKNRIRELNHPVTSSKSAVRSLNI